MKASYLDDKACRCTLQILRELGVNYWFIPLDTPETSLEILAQLKHERKLVSEEQVRWL